MAEIVNLRRARKAKVRLVKEDVAAENRTRFGLSKGEKAILAKRAAQETHHLDGHYVSSADQAVKPKQDEP